MRLFFFSLLSAVFFACADNPLAERVDELEQRLSTKLKPPKRRTG